MNPRFASTMAAVGFVLAISAVVSAAEHLMIALKSHGMSRRGRSSLNLAASYPEIKR